MKCDFCGEEIGGDTYSYETGGNKRIKSKTLPLPFTCRGCGGTFCSKHRLPETHNCARIPIKKPYSKYTNYSRTTTHITPDIIDNSKAERIKKPIINKKEIEIYIYIMIFVIIIYSLKVMTEYFTSNT